MQKRPFADICILCKMKGWKSKHKYIDLVSSILEENEAEVLDMPKSCQYLLSFCKTEDKDYRWVAEITLPELLELANLHSKNFITTVTNGVDDGDTILAQICANKIMNYAYGVAINKTDGSEDSTTYQFTRQRFTESEDGKKRRCRYVVLEKDFRRVACL